MKNKIDLSSISNTGEIKIEFRGDFEGLELITLATLKLEKPINYFSEELQEKSRRLRDLFQQINFKNEYEE